VINSDPPESTTHFNKKEIRITFNKYIQLKDQANQIIIAPPYLSHTDIRLHGKSILIKLADSLKSNTTYSINFGDAISDITENNILHDYTYNFSTGSFIDSLSLSGRIINAFDLTPQKDVLAMLYVNENDTLPLDSLPLHVKPYYLAKANENGDFRFRNLRDVPYLLFVLKDLNGDHIYNPPHEKIAFLDSLVKGEYILPPTPEMLKKDSIAKADTIHPKKDTTLLKTQTQPGYTLRLFEQSDSIQKILKADMVNEDQVGINFRVPAINPQFVPLNLSNLTKGWMIPEFNPGMDSVFLWVTNTGKDSLYLQILDNNKTIDTARIDLTKKTLKKKKTDKEGTSGIKLKLSTNMTDSRLNQFRYEPTIISSYPLSKSDFHRILLVDGKDTVHPKLAYADSIKRRIRISYKWKEDHPYRLIIPDSIFQSFNGHSNDSLLVSFRTHALRDFGSLQMTITLKIASNFIIQLLDEKDNILEQRIITASGKVKFDYLPPAKYRIKAIQDLNKNGHWDSGNFFRKLQPEPVQYYQKTIEVHANWDIEETWEL
jgi:hypothetical protein